jgi:hypothetical protein
MNGLFPSDAPAPGPAFPSSCRILPDYRNGSIVNLMASIIEGLGGVPAGYSPLLSLTPAEIGKHQQIVLIVMDGLGDDFLSRIGQNTRVAECRRDRLTSVFPSTTAAAVTTFLTGLAPQQHGLTGWHMFFRELGAVLAVLPGVPRYGGVSLRQAGWDVPRFFGHRPVFDLMPVASRVVTPAQIAHSDFNLAHLGRAKCEAFDTLEGFFAAIAGDLSHHEDRRFVYAYWSELDHIAHESGIFGVAAERHFKRWDRAFDQFLQEMSGTNSLIIVTADHGFIDTDESHTVDLADHPHLAECLALPLCGESRAAYGYVKPHRSQSFEDYVHEQLAHAVELHRSDDLIEQGWFGLGSPHPGLAARIGDYTLVMKENYVIRDWMPGKHRHRQVGVHGGINAAEMWVPLAVVAV